MRLRQPKEGNSSRGKIKARRKKPVTMRMDVPSLRRWSPKWRQEEALEKTRKRDRRKGGHWS